MSTENLEPIVHFVIEGKGYDGNEWTATSGTPGEMVVFPESSEEGRAVVEAMRAYAVTRLDYHITAAALVRNVLDFSVPNQPLESQVREIVKHLDSAGEAARVLAELAPWLYDDDEGDDPEPEPSPDPSSSKALNR